MYIYIYIHIYIYMDIFPAATNQLIIGKSSEIIPGPDPLVQHGGRDLQGPTRGGAGGRASQISGGETMGWVRNPKKKSS